MDSSVISPAELGRRLADGWRRGCTGRFGPERKDGLTSYSLRVRAYGKREMVTLATDADGLTMRKAERFLEQVLAEIQVGVWRPPSLSAGGGPDVPRVRVAVVVRRQV